MKKIIIFISMCILVLYTIDAYCKSAPDKKNPPKDKLITIQYSPEMLDLVQQWKDEYCRENPEIGNDMIVLEELNTTTLDEKSPGLLLISNSYQHTFDYNAGLRLVVGRDILVPVINSNNPFIEQISKKGITIDELKELISLKSGHMLPAGKSGDETIRFNYYQLASDEMNRFFPFPTEENTSIKVASSKDLVSSVQNDVYGLAICRLADIVNLEEQSWVDQIALLPIDKNVNGKIDSFEKIYASPIDFSRGVWIGKYPRSLVNNFYIMAGDHPENTAEIAFIKWLINDGQELVVANGFNELVYSEKKSNFSKLNNFRYVPPAAERRSYIFLKISLFFLIAAAFVIPLFSIRKKPGSSGNEVKSPTQTATISNSTMKVPEGLFFDKTHTWIFMEEEGTVKVGIDDFMQHVTGPLTRIKMKKPGDSLKKNDLLVTLIQDGKQLNVYAPVSGEIIGINEKLETDPETVNTSPYADGWIYAIKPTNYLREMQFLRMAGNYRQWLKDEINRLKDFLAVSSSIQSLELAKVAYQEGGEIQDHVLVQYGPEVWENFQKKFIDTASLA